MGDAIINFKTDSAIKRQLQRKAEKFGMNVTTALNLLIRKFLRADDIDFIEEGEGELTDWAKEELRKAEEDIRAGRVMSFNNWEEEKAYLDKLITNARKRDKR